MVEGKAEKLLTQHNLEKKPEQNPQQQKAQAH